jgi:O-antigen/teichoic acid export membrane protein
MRRILENVFSNWAGLVVSVVIAFVVSPIIVNTLGKEIYGVWILIVSITGYFTVLDFGVNTAIVRYISNSVAKHDFAGARAIYSTSIAIFAVVALTIFLFSVIFGFFLPDIFEIHQVARSYLYAVFLVSAVDLASGLLFSVYQGALVGLQEFKYINGTSIGVNIVRSVVLVWSLKNGAGLLTLASLQLIASLTRAACQFVLLNKRHKYLYFNRQSIDRSTVANIYNYSVYSFIIAVALKLLFYTDSVVIGARIGVAEVAYYAIPSTLLDYLEKFVWAMIAVLVPIISSNQARGEETGNIRLYILGTRYSLLVSMPVIISLYFFGHDFIRLWMGPEFGKQCIWVLRILLVGFGFSFSQLIAHGLLKGISKHKVLAYILAIEALVNLVMSIVLAKPYGIEGVAFGTMVPLVISSFVIIYYTCRLLKLSIWRYLVQSYLMAIAGLAFSLIAIYFVDNYIQNYFALFTNCAFLSVSFMAIALPLSLEVDHRKYLLQKILK